MNFKDFVKAMAEQGTMVVGVDSCMCNDCVERRESGDIRQPKILSEEEE